MGRGDKGCSSRRSRFQLAACIFPGDTSLPRHWPVCHRPLSSRQVLCLAEAGGQRRGEVEGMEEARTCQASLFLLSPWLTGHKCSPEKAIPS